ncbi:hypothetical protein [Prochlorococcus sp. MIT 1341]|uniref:hypothetical protein n=1 Tax=Prochlorococcus sp. MIT 1341 TaxID=3096221 RepID=UPI002A74AD52|nr:hypothetical protein [Prochlorococcus sp. MIT 1341]
MTQIFEYSWLIPVLPLVASSFLGLLLVAFSLTMNRLSKPVFAITFGSCLFSTIISYSLLYHEINFPDDSYSFDLKLALSKFTANLEFFADLLTSSILAIISTIVLIIMFILHRQNQRKKGYVRLFVIFGFMSSAISTAILTLPISSYIH